MMMMMMMMMKKTCNVSTVTILTTLRKADMLIALGTGGDGLVRSFRKPFIILV